MAAVREFELFQDKKGVYWDLLLYIPTVIALLSVAFQMWYAGNEGFTYMLIFLTTFIVLIGFNRIAKTRLMVVGSSPVAFDVSKKGVAIRLRSGAVADLQSDVRFFSDLAGKSFGLTGQDLEGKKRQFVFHKGQFQNENVFNDAKASLRVFK